jgi:C-terminal processing protease CtpA/Prc
MVKGKPVGLITVKSFSTNTRDDVMDALVELHKGGDKDVRID